MSFKLFFLIGLNLAAHVGFAQSEVIWEQIFEETYSKIRSHKILVIKNEHSIINKSNFIEYSHVDSVSTKLLGDSLYRSDCLYNLYGFSPKGKVLFLSNYDPII